jgi:hypothetical protein
MKHIDDKTVITFSNKGEINFVKIRSKDTLEAKISKSMQTQYDDDEMYDSDDEDSVYTKSLKNSLFYAVTSNETHIAYCAYENSQVY